MADVQAAGFGVWRERKTVRKSLWVALWWAWNGIVVIPFWIAVGCPVFVLFATWTAFEILIGLAVGRRYNPANQAESIFECLHSYIKAKANNVADVNWRNYFR